MFRLLKAIWNDDRRGFMKILMLSIMVSLMGGFSIALMLPMLNLMESSRLVSGDGFIAWILSGLSPLQSALLLAGVYAALLTFKAFLGRHLSVCRNAFFCAYTQRQRSELYACVSDASWQYLAAQKRTDLIDLFTSRCGQVSSGISSTIQMISDLVSAAVQLALAAYMSLPITMLVCLAGALLLLLFWPLKKKSRNYGQEMIEISRSFYAELFNQLNSVKEIRSYGVEKEHAARFEEISGRFTDAQRRYARLSSLPGLVYSVSAAVVIAALFVISSIGLRMDTAHLLVLVVIFSRLWPFFSGFQGTMQSIHSCVPALDKIDSAISAMRADMTESDNHCEMVFKRSIGFSDVEFAYHDSDESVLCKLNFDIKFGEITALVGQSGAGKTTIANLLMGFLNPTSGEIRIDGIPLDQKNIRAWRRLVSYVPQDPLVLNASVRDNLLRFHPGATESQMIDALKRAQAWSFVSRMEKGMDTLLGDQGVRLSGGERQRIVLARVLLGDPQIILLDEATSALDYQSEIAIREVLHGLRGKVTVVIIAHRLATIKIADQALVLENGSITEYGSIQELMKNSDGYLSCMGASE